MLGPELWNISYDDILKLELPDGCYLVGYADDIAIVITGRDEIDIQRKLNLIMILIRRWLNDHGLELAAEKTELIFLTRKQRASFDNIQEVHVEELKINTKEHLKYLGFTLDTKMTFGEHITKAADKASVVTASLSRLMRNVGGPRASKRRLLMSVTNSILLYGAEIWGETPQKEVYRTRIARVQRTAALRICSAYRTVSETAVLVIAGVIPVDLLALERKTLYDRRKAADRSGQQVSRVKIAKEERSDTLDQWQRRYEADRRGRWTARLIPRIQNWIERDHGEVNYYTTQLLTGHGYFRSYLSKMGKVTSSNCLACGHTTDNVEHTLFVCDLWRTERQLLTDKISSFNPDNIVELMLQSVESWNAVNAYVEAVLRAKKREGLVDDPRT